MCKCLNDGTIRRIYSTVRIRKMDPVAHNVKIYNRHVKEYVSRFMDLSLYKDTFDSLLQVLPFAGKVLELGCGPGNVIRYLSGQRPDLIFHGIDLADEMLKAARWLNPASTFQRLDIREAGGINTSFDAVIAAFCIPYLSSKDLPRLFIDLNRLTVENGAIYLSCMEGDYERSRLERTSFTGADEMFITYYPRAGIEQLLHAHRFEVISFLAKEYPESDGGVTTELMYTAVKY